MKTLAKLFVVSACIVLGMTSCLKNSDPDFGISGANLYMLQRNEVQGNDTVALFAPYILFATNEPLAKASVTSLTFIEVPGSINSYYWESKVPDSKYLSELESESYTFTAFNAAGEKAIYTFQMGVSQSEAIGEFEANFTYDSKEGITVKWDAPKNANYFELVVWLENNSDRKAVIATTSKNEITFSNYQASTIGFESGKEYNFELVAYSAKENIIKIKLENRSGKNRFRVNSWGTDNAE